jgi:hypothetical protein
MSNQGWGILIASIPSLLVWVCIVAAIIAVLK